MPWEGTTEAIVSRKFWKRTGKAMAGNAKVRKKCRMQFGMRYTRSVSTWLRRHQFAKVNSEGSLATLLCHKQQGKFLMEVINIQREQTSLLKQYVRKLQGSGY